MSSTARQLPRSKAGVSFYLIGAALVGISLLGFIYSFLPRKTNSSEIDLGSQFSRLPGMAMAPSLEQLVELTAKMPGESWICLGYSQIKEADLRLLKFFARPRRPLGLAYTLYGRADAKLGGQKS